MKKIVALLVLLITLSGCNGNSEEKESAYLEQVKDLATISYQLASDSETIAVEYLDIWHTVIFDKAVMVNEKSYTDFDDALSAKYMQNSQNNVFEPIYKLSAEAKSIYKELKEKETEKYQHEFDLTREFYLKCAEFEEFSLETYGSYNSYSEEFKSKRDEIMSLYSTLKIELDL